jgi:phosphatidylserine/phosphatidylglycerophosphate/cardiolipin synthase-like enzyme
MSYNPIPQAVAPLIGQETAEEILQCIGAFSLLRSALIVTYAMQDYEFIGHGLVSDLLRRQLALGAEITVATTPPPYSPKKNPYRDKLKLLETLEQDGIKVLINHRIHAKVYMFIDDRERLTAIVGSANLSHGGFGVEGGITKTLLELSLLTGDPDLFGDIRRCVERSIIADKDTVDFATWRSLNLSDVAIAKGA